MKVIFLDFDGVLNNWETKRKAPEWAAKKHPYIWIEKELVEKIGDLVEKTSAKIVVSSTWRNSYNVEELNRILSDEDPRLVDTVISKTIYIGDHAAVRGKEIQQWLHEHPEVTSYVVLDDNPWCRQHGERFIQTDDSCGITNDNVEKANDLLHQ